MIPISPCIASRELLPEFGTVEDLSRLALTFADLCFFFLLYTLSDGKYMKGLDSLSMYTCNRFKQSLASGKLLSLPSVLLTSSSCFEVFLNLMKYIKFHLVLPETSKGKMYMVL